MANEQTAQEQTTTEVKHEHVRETPVFYPENLICAHDQVDKAKLTLIMDYEKSLKGTMKYGLGFTTESTKAIRYALREKVAANVVVISSLAQVAQVCISVFIKSVVSESNQNNDWDYTLFRQASYSEPCHNHIDLTPFPEEKKAIEALIEDIRQSSQGKRIENAFFAIYYIPEETIRHLIAEGGDLQLVDFVEPATLSDETKKELEQVLIEAITLANTTNDPSTPSIPLNPTIPFDQI